jgi:hypothetical protein
MTDHALKIVGQAKYVGGYRLGEVGGSFTFNLTRKPSAWHRFWMRACLGWVWVDQ